MKRVLSIIAVTLITFTAATAQRISVVTEDGTTSIHRTLQQAIEEADPGSTIYLPGGGFTLPDSVKITKRLTIIGIGHKSSNENADGSTIISGNLWFNEGSSGSAIMSCYITGDINVGDGGAEVNDVTIKYCNFYRIMVKNNTCQETVINQNYIRYQSYFNGANAFFTNNIAYAIMNLDNGLISNNIFTGTTKEIVDNNWGTTSLHGVDNTIIMKNIFLSAALHSCRNCTISDNMGVNQNIGNDCINLSEVSWNDVFENYNGGAISPVSKFHFKDNYNQYEHQVGIYAGDGFNDSQLAPVPYIISKDIPQQTDAAGKLNIKIRVKAGD